MKKLLLFFLLISAFSACNKRKQRDVRKLNWFEISTDARGQSIQVLVPENEKIAWEARFLKAADQLTAHANAQVKFVGCSPTAINDSLRQFCQSSLVLMSGKSIEDAIQQGFIMGPFDRILPVSKELNTDADAFRFSEGISTQGFAVPLHPTVNDTTAKAGFFAVPMKGQAQAAALLLLESLLEEELAADSSMHK